MEIAMFGVVLERCHCHHESVAYIIIIGML